MGRLLIVALALAAGATSGCSLIVNGKLDNSDEDASVADGPRADLTQTDGPLSDGPQPDTAVDDATADQPQPDFTVDGHGPIFLNECGGNTVATNLSYAPNGSSEGFYAAELGNDRPVVAVRAGTSKYDLLGYDDASMQFSQAQLAQFPPINGQVGRLAVVPTDDDVVHALFLVKDSTNKTTLLHTYISPAATDWAAYQTIVLPGSGGSSGFWISAAASPGGTVIGMVTSDGGPMRWPIEIKPNGTGDYDRMALNACAVTGGNLFPRLRVSPNGSQFALTYVVGNQAKLEVTSNPFSFCPGGTTAVNLPGGDVAAAPIAYTDHAGVSLQLARGDGNAVEHRAQDTGGAHNTVALPVFLGAEPIDLVVRKERVYVLLRDAPGGGPGQLAIASAEIVGTNSVGPFEVLYVARDGVPGRLLLDDLGRGHVLFEEKQGASNFKLDYVCVELPYGGGGGGPTGQCGDGFCEGTAETCSQCPVDCTCGPNQGALIAFWPFDDWSNSIASDATGNGHAGNRSGDINGEILTGLGAAFDFLPNGGVVDVPSLVGNADLASPLTVSFWVFPASSKDSVLMRNGHPNGGFEIARTPGDQLQVGRGVPGGGPPILGGNLPSVTWTHITVVFDQNNQVRLYRNGSPSGTGNMQLTTSPAPILIGGDRMPGGSIFRGFDGQIDHVKIFNFAMPATQVLAEFNSGQP